MRNNYFQGWGEIMHLKTASNEISGYARRGSTMPQEKRHRRRKRRGHVAEIE